MCSLEARETENRGSTYGLIQPKNTTLTLFFGISIRLCKFSLLLLLRCNAICCDHHSERRQTLFLWFRWVCLSTQFQWVAQSMFRRHPNLVNSFRKQNSIWEVFCFSIILMLLYAFFFFWTQSHQVSIVFSQEHVAFNFLSRLQRPRDWCQKSISQAKLAESLFLWYRQLHGTRLKHNNYQLKLCLDQQCNAIY